MRRVDDVAGRLRLLPLRRDQWQREGKRAALPGLRFERYLALVRFYQIA